MFLGEGEALGEGLGEGRGEGRGDGRDEAGLEPISINHIVYFVQLTVLDPGKCPYAWNSNYEEENTHS